MEIDSHKPIFANTMHAVADVMRHRRRMGTVVCARARARTETRGYKVMRSRQRDTAKTLSNRNLAREYCKSSERASITSKYEAFMRHKLFPIAVLRLQVRSTITNPPMFSINARGDRKVIIDARTHARARAQFCAPRKNCVAIVARD